MSRPLLPAMMQILAEIRDVPPTVWQDPEQVKELAARLAKKLGVPVTEQQLAALKTAFVSATKNKDANAPVDVEGLVNKYGPKGQKSAASNLFKNLLRRPR